MYIHLVHSHGSLPSMVAELVRPWLIKVEAPRCGTSVVRGPTGHK